MAVVINGTTGLSGVSTVNLANGSVTQNILANGVGATGPAFRAYKTGTTSFSLNTATKIVFDVEMFDTANCYDPSLSRFTPNVAGYYYVTSTVDIYMSSGNGTYIQCIIYRNGSNLATGSNTGSQVSQNTSVASTLTYMNGTTDYLEVYAFVFTSSGGNPIINAGSNNVFFTSFLARAA